MKLRILLLGVVALTDFGCTNRIVSKVGSSAIRQLDVERREAIVEIYYPNERRAVGLSQLREAFLQAEILKQLGHPVTDEVLHQEASRIARDTAAPEALESIRRIFGSDEASYLRVFVLPAYVHRVLYYDVFLHEVARQSEAADAAEGLLRRAQRDPGAFHEWGRRHDEDLKTVRISVDGKFLFPQRKGFPPSELLSWGPVVPSDFKTGRLYPRVIDADEFFVVCRCLNKSADGMEVEVALFRKPDFSTWLAQQARLVNS